VPQLLRPDQRTRQMPAVRLQVVLGLQSLQSQVARPQVAQWIFCLRPLGQREARRSVSDSYAACENFSVQELPGRGLRIKTAAGQIFFGPFTFKRAAKKTYQKLCRNRTY
jgi:hypothetical protein